MRTCPRLPSRLSWLVCLASLAGGCTSDEWPIDPDDYIDGGSSDDGMATVGIGPALDGAALEVFEPESASVYFLGESLPLIAEVTDADGNPAGIDDVTWRADGVDFALGTGAMTEVDLPVGVYDITAEVELPDGGRLSTSVGGVRVQSPNTGIYAGEIAMALTVDLQGMALEPVCRGATTVTIDMEGETLSAEPGSCTLDLLLTSLPADFEIDAVLYGNAVSGEVVFTFAGLFMASFDFEGTLFDDTLYSGFIGELAIPLLLTAPADGTFVAEKLSPFVEP